MALLTRETIDAALTLLDAELGRTGTHASLYLVGGAVLCLVFNTRDPTRDVDLQPSSVVRAAARRSPSSSTFPFATPATPTAAPPRQRRDPRS
jgi:hypothetical protein